MNTNQPFIYQGTHCTYDEVLQKIEPFVEACWSLMKEPDYMEKVYLSLYEDLLSGKISLEYFIEEAKKNKKFWVAIGGYVVFLSKRNIPLPIILAEFVEYQTKNPCPRKKGKDSLDEMHIRRFTLHTIALAVKLGLPRSRRKNKLRKGESAYDLVITLFKKHGRRVHKITSLEDLLRAYQEEYEEIFNTL